MMPSYIPITEKLNLIYQEVKLTSTVSKKKPVNHIWVYDRSCSMYYTIKELTEQLITLSKKLPVGDTLTLGWFSGVGDFNFVVKGFKIQDDSDYAALERAIRANNTVRNTTCFSEILNDLTTVINDLSMFSDMFALHFFTDGYPVVSNHHQEIEGIFDAIKNIKGKINTAMFVGYGSYYNKVLMSEMAEKMGALLIHSSMVPEYADSITKLISLSGSQESKQEVDPLIQDPLAVFTLTEQGVMLHSIEDGKLLLSPQKGKVCPLFYISDQKPNKKSWKKILVDYLDFAKPNEKYSQALYAAALVLAQQMHMDTALEIIGKMGDKKIVDMMVNAFTIEEYGRVETALNNCIQDIRCRFNGGRDPHYLPAEDAFCVFDLLKTLVEDKEAFFYPYHKSFKYERTGVPSIVEIGYPLFMADDGIKCSFSNLVWHSSRLNLSVNTKIDGVIYPLDVGNDTAESLGLPSYVNTFIFRSYTFIRDGRIHIKKFPVISSESTYNLCKNNGIIIDDDFFNSKKYTIDVSSLSVINRKMCANTSATKLCVDSFEELRLKALIKSLKWLQTDVVGEEKPVSKYNDDQASFLEANGINLKSGNFSPPTERQEALDQYLAKSFKIKIAKHISLPPVKKVIDKIAAGKKRTPIELLLEEGIMQYRSIAPCNSLEEMTAWFKRVLGTQQKELRRIRSGIQETKFAIIMGQKWFDEFESRDNSFLEIDGVTYRFELGEEIVAL